VEIIDFCKKYEKQTAYNIMFANWRFSAPQTHLWLIKALVLHINICGENRQLRQAPNRHASPYDDRATNELTEKK